MGFLKRFFSIGSKRNKKRQTGFEIEHIEPTIQEAQEDEQEAAVTRLLRSSSAHFAVVSEVDYASLPPLPHPINNVLLTPAASTASISSASQRGSYNVKVGRRMHHTLTEFPNAYPTLREGSPTLDQPRRHDPITPRDKSRMHVLRQDPSVASLLNMYDEHGRLDSGVFSNTPPHNDEKEGRAQTRRTGSTLRQLLGNPSSRSSRDARNSSALEGDISWAERFLGEQLEDDDASSTSSLGLPGTPTDALFPTHTHSQHIHMNNTLSTDHDTSRSTTTPAISSMEVEVSIVTSSASHDHLAVPKSPYQSQGALSPNRASQIFSFLKNKEERTSPDSDRPLPALPLFPPDSPPASRFSSDTSHGAVDITQIPNDTHAIRPPRRHSTLSSNDGLPLRSTNPFDSSAQDQLQVALLRTRSQSTSAADTLRDGPTLHPVVVTSPDAVLNSGRIRGPRPLNSFVAHTIRPLNDTKQARAPPGEQSSAVFDPFTPAPPRQAHRRTSSRASSALSLVDFEDEEYIAQHPAPPIVEKRVVKNPHVYNDKEKENGPMPASQRSNSKISEKFYKFSNIKPQLPPIPPITPLSRSRTLFRAQIPSPASSSELSPVAKDMMSDLRKKRQYSRGQGRNQSKLR